VTILFTDDFQRADENPLGNGNWSTWNAFAPFEVTSLECKGTANPGNNGSIVTAGSFPDDGYAKVTLGTIGGVFAGAMYRANASGSYGFQRTGTGGQLFKFDPGYTALDSPTFTNNPGDTYEVRCIGTAITGWHNGVQVASATDGAFASGDPGMYAFVNDAILAFEAGNFAAGGSPIPYYAQRRRLY
jgi:hypothetical protein